MSKIHQLDIATKYSHLFKHNWKKKNITQSIHFMKYIFSAERPRPKC